jgi:putative methyltransferase (TIGR04325 family)
MSRASSLGKLSGERTDKDRGMTNFRVWEGVYPSFAEAPEIGPGFAGEIWRERGLASTRRALDDLRMGRSLKGSLRHRNAVLSTLVAVLLANRQRLDICDFGGGFGAGFLVLQSSIPAVASRVAYHIVELDHVCEGAIPLFAGGPGPNFHKRPPSAASFDIIYSSSMIQYSEDWRAMIELMTSYGAPFLLYADLFVGDFPAFVTLQYYYGSRIRHWFLNLEEFVSEVEQHGYSLALRSDCNPEILGVRGPLPMENFPPDLRLEHTHNLLFVKSIAD